MRHTLLLLFLLSYGWSNESFPDLKRASQYYLDWPENAFIAYDSTKFFNTNISCSDLDESHEFYCESPEYFQPYSIRVKSIKSDFEIFFHPSPSNDPYFSIYKNGKLILKTSGIRLFIRNTETVYTSGHTNNWHNQKRKFTLIGGKFIEVKQPYYYVGLKTSPLKTITIYETRKLEKKVATLPKGYEVEIILEDTNNNSTNDYFLIKTKFGLTGWFRTEYQESNKIFKKLIYKGD